MTGLDGLSRPATPARRPTRRPRTDRWTTGWLLAILAVTAVGLLRPAALPQPLWSMIHVGALGVLTNGILQWSWYFTRALLHLPPDDRRSGRDATIRSVAFNVVLIGLVAAMWTASTWGTVTAAGLVGVVIGWHGLALLRAARTALASRFAVVIRYYVVASGFLVIGSVLAGFLTVSMFARTAPAWLLRARDDLTLAHALVNVGGWLGLSIAGTLVTLGPTMLRTRMDPRAVHDAMAVLPWLAGGVLLAATAATAGLMPGIGIGLLVVLVGLLVGVAVPLVRAALGKAPRAYATWTMTAGIGWALVAVTAIAVNAFRAADASALRDADLPWLAVLGAGGLAQVFVGALTYLMPVVVGGGPEAVRRGMAVLETVWPLRVALRSSALVLLAVSGTVAGPLVTAWWILVLLTYAVDVVLFALAGVRQAKARRALEAPAVPGPPGSGVTPAERPLGPTLLGGPDA